IENAARITGDHGVGESGADSRHLGEFPIACELAEKISRATRDRREVPDGVKNQALTLVKLGVAAIDLVVELLRQRSRQRSRGLRRLESMRLMRVKVRFASRS